MAIPPPKPPARAKFVFSSDPHSLIPRVLSIVAVLYAFLAAFHTVQDFDLGWQLATGRWIVQHHRIFSVDVFSYTAAGQPWIYPALSGLLLYLTYLAGGYALLTWLGAIVSAGAVALLLRPKTLAVSALAVIAAPLIANRTQPRAEMFTTILFAAFITILWRYYRTGQGRLWILPLLMLLWVNLHPGFVAGLGLCMGYVAVELLALVNLEARTDAIARLRRIWPWLAATAVATFVNPHGPFIYGALWRQEQAQALHSSWVVEWQGVRLSASNLNQALDWRNPQSAFWWLLAVAVIASAIALWRREWGAALLLAASSYFALQHVRLQALFASIVVVVGGSIVDALIAQTASPPVSKARRKVPARSPTRLAPVGSMALAVCLFVLAAVRCTDLIDNRNYMRFAQLSAFGPGLSWWYPERAAQFVEREHLPGNIFNGYALGGFLTWRLFPEYRDYIDSRALPFGPELFFRAYDLSTEPPDSPAWLQEADTRGINTIIVPLSRYQGMTLFPHLSDFCRSKSWRAVYLDEVSAVFVRVTPQTAPLSNRLRLDCATASFQPHGDAHQSKAEAFNFSANAGGVLYSLERYPQALAQLENAQSIFGENASVHLLRGLVLQQMARDREAESEFRTSVQLEPSDEAWFDLGLFYMTRQRYSEAAEIFLQSTETSSRPHEMWMMLGQAYLGTRQSQRAMEAFDRAVASSPFRGESAALGASFYSLVATGRAKASYQLGDIAQAVSFQEEAVKLAPQDAKLWLGLSNLYQVQGQISKAADAKMRAQILAAK